MNPSAMPPARRAPTIAALLACCALAAPGASRAAGGDTWSHAPYALGQGLYFPAQGLRVGGYANLQYYDVANDSPTLNSHDISLFVTKDLGTRAQLFTELDAGDAIQLGGSPPNRRHSELDVERLYVDYHARAWLNLRLGKFLTPVGQWNQVHADPLTWTVSRPLATSAAFARHAAGAMAFGTVTARGHDLDYWLFADDSRDLDVGPDQDRAYVASGTDLPNRNNFRHAVGGRLLWHARDDRFTLGMSLLGYRLDIPRRDYRLVGVDFGWNGRHLSLDGEGIYREGGRPGEAAETGGFVEAEVPLIRRLYLVGRLERYRTSTPPQTVTLRTLALNFRPTPGLVLKLEHRDGNRSTQLAPAGWLASFAVLF
ncbi:MAG: hypothetical protein KGN77_00565 [Xanthomonadaceae bacterium]|nr:hypothetical protein [Xanthomonadaceae bacterium]MDE1964491.1 hypothetical protein [Xanthomonadaceae bacterium]